MGQKVDFKNVQRRVYDALNVLSAMDIIRKDKYNIIYNHKNEHIIDSPVSASNLTPQSGGSDESLEYNSDFDPNLDPEMIAQEQQMIEQQRLIQLRQAQEYHEKRVKQAEADLTKLRAAVADKQKLVQELVK